MEFELHEINVTLSNDQKQKIRNAFINRGKIRLRLSKDSLRGSDTLLVPTRFFEEMDNEDGIDAVVDEQTAKEMWDEMREDFKSFRDEKLSDVLFQQIKTDFGKENSLYKKYEKLKSFKDENLSDEMLECKICQEIWRYYELFFDPATVESMENKGIEFNLDYSLLNDLAKDFVKDNVKKLFE